MRACMLRARACLASSCHALKICFQCLESVTIGVAKRRGKCVQPRARGWMQTVVVKTGQINTCLRPAAMAAAAHRVIRGCLVAAVARIRVARVPRCVHEQANHRVSGEEVRKLMREPPT